MKKIKSSPKSVSNKDLQMVIDEAPCTISWVKNNLRYIGVNRGLSELCGVDAREFVNRQVGFYTNEKYFQHFVERLFQSDEERIAEELHATIDGESKWYFIVGRKYKANQEAVLIGVDITPQKNAEQQLVFNEKMASIGQMAASIAHEINSPLSILMMRTEALKSLKITDHRIKTEIDDIANKLMATEERISKIINGLKSFSRDSSDDPFEQIQLSKIIQSSVDLCERRLYHSGVELRLKANADCSIFCNEIQLSQVLVNLIGNSVDAIETLPTKWIELETKLAPDSVTIFVTDSGSGIPEKIREKIFAPFFSTKEKGKGTGLGLSISKAIVEKHHGHFRIDAKNPNTRFVITLPRSKIKLKSAA